MTTTYDTPRQTIEQTVKDRFTTLPLVFDNTPSRDGEFVRVITEPGLSVSALTGGGGLISAGSNTIQRHQGAAVFEININKNAGTTRANAVAEELKQLFVRNRINEVTFKGSDIVRTGETDAHFRLSLFIYYYHDNR